MDRERLDGRHDTADVARKATRSGTTQPPEILSLQRRAGNRAVAALVQSVQREDGDGGTKEDLTRALVPYRGQDGNGGPKEDLTKALVPYHAQPTDDRGGRRAAKLREIEQRRKLPSTGETFVAKEGGEVFTPSQHRRDQKLRQLEQQKREFEKPSMNKLVASETEVLGPQASWEFRRDLKLQEIEMRKRELEAPLGTMVAMPGTMAVPGKILDPEGSKEWQKREDQGRTKQPDLPGLEKERTDRVAEWELQSKAQRIYEPIAPNITRALESKVHKPVGLPAMADVVQTAWGKQEYQTVIDRGPDLADLVEKVVAADAKLAVVTERYDDLPPVDDTTYGVYRKNTKQWLDAYPSIPWAEQGQELKKIDEKVFEYIKRINDRKLEAAAGTKTVVDAKNQGRIASDGTIIVRKAPGDFPPEEKTKIERALRRLDGENLWWSGKWGVDHGNNEGRLPGTKGGGGYKEYYVEPGLGQTPPGPRRFCVKNAKVFYSNTHYGESGKPAFYAVRGWA